LKWMIVDILPNPVAKKIATKWAQESFISQLLSELRNPHASLAWGAAIGLAHLPRADTVAVHRLARGLKDPDVEVRKLLGLVLGNVGMPGRRSPHWSIHPFLSRLQTDGADPGNLAEVFLCSHLGYLTVTALTPTLALSHALDFDSVLA
jgi:hypothetical protein